MFNAAENLIKAKTRVRIFLMNDAVDMTRDVCHPPEGYDQGLLKMLKNLIFQGTPVKVCGTCMARCGIHKDFRSWTF
ncbi:MAG: DsrE family protein [Oligoflexia bacterium]|nr:DsrE family protein [Oligoflexia bacterium]